MTTNNDERVYIRGLNGLRAIAAIGVVTAHTNLFLAGFKELKLGGLSVTIFFALSGFLITYLLFLEKEKAEINIKHFYVRRILRIWPLYFFYLSICIVTAYFFARGSLPGSLPYYLFFAANIPFILKTTLLNLPHFWSLGVEEQFYVFWPWTIKYSRNILRTISVFTIALIALRAVLYLWFLYSGRHHTLYFASWITRFDCMAIGAIGAVLLLEKKTIFIQIVKHKLTQLVSWGTILLIVFNVYPLWPVIGHDIVAVITVILIINLGFNESTLISLEKPLFNFLGKISYGIYVYHYIIVFFFGRFLYHFQLNPIVKLFVIYLGVYSLTILCAYLSYEFFEKKFLRLKDRFSTVKSSG